MGIFRLLLQKVQRHRDSAAYWRKQGARIGEECEIYSTASFGSEPYLITVGNHVRINSGVQLVTHDGGVWVLRGLYEELRQADMFGTIVIGDNVHIGTNAIIMPGVTIGSNCVIGCGAIVTRDIPDNSIAVGIPARVIETVEEYREKNESRMETTKGMNWQEKNEYLCQKYSIAE